METVNKIHAGLHVDFNPYDQPADTMRDNRNGIVMDLEDGSHMWTNLKGTLIVFQLDQSDTIMSHCIIRNRLFFLVFNNADDFVIIYEIPWDESGDFGNKSNIWQGSNTKLNLSLDHPITSMFGFYENDDIQRIFFNDDFNQPRVLNVGSGGSITLEEKFIDFFPVMDPVYGNFQLAGIVSGGNCKAGMYFFTWRFFKAGYYTDWSYLTTPVAVTPSIPGIWFDDFQQFEGGAPDENCSKRIRIILGSLDTDYDSIQVAAFYANDYNSAQPGVIFYDGDISAGLMILDFTGSENLGIVTIDELMETTIVVETAKDMQHIKKMNILAGVKERQEIDVSNLAGGKNNQIRVTMEYITKPILLDTRNYSDENYTNGENKALCGTRDVSSEIAIHGLIPRIWYSANFGGVTFTDNGGDQSYDSYEVFTINSGDAVAITTGGVRMAIVKRMYKPASAGNDINESVLFIHILTDGYYNYKNPIFANELRGYPAGEKVRLGVLFSDKTGRPFFIRHLYNLTETYEGITIGPGDFTTPRAGDSTDDMYTRFHNHYSYDAGTQGHRFIIGNIRGIEISGIDITNIKDQIGSFSIVRCPIVRERIGYGILGHMLKDGLDITIKPGFVGYINDGYIWAKGYPFYCPEELFGLTGFSIQPGDKIVNEFYLDPENAGEYVLGDNRWTGYGRLEQANAGENICLYQKFVQNVPSGELPGSGNGMIETEHELTFVTKFRMGDDSDDAGIVIDPSDETILFKERLKPFNEPGPLYSRATNLTIFIFDELSDAGADIKGMFDLDREDPKVLICSVKRENNSPYGGLGDSSLANSLYISTGHHQIINDDVLSKIWNGSQYIFNNIEIFGGDAYLGMFDFNYCLLNEDVIDDEVNHSFIVPLESRINIDLREGNHIAKLRSFHANIEPTGLRKGASYNQWSEFNYNDGYSSENINDFYLPLPYDFELESTFDTRLRYSPVKSYGELEDSFRKFEALSYIDLATEYGAITNIRAKQSRLIYWQRDAVGYVPINERALSSAALGTPVQLGIGGIFERHDEVITMIGNSNHFGLVESIAGFHWYDAVRKIFITLGNDMKLSHDSIAKGLDSFFVNNIPNNMDEYDNPGKDYGIIGGYDIRNKLVLMTFRMPGEIYETIAYNIKKDKFIGYFDYQAKYYFVWKDWLYSIADDRNIIHQHGEGIYGTYHGITSPMYFSIIVKDDSNVAKIFDNFEYIGSENTFTKLIYENTDQLIEEVIANNRFIKYRNKRYYGSFPKINRERLMDGYLKITFYYDGSDRISFNELKTTFRKMI